MKFAEIVSREWNDPIARQTDILLALVFATTIAGVTTIVSTAENNKSPYSPPPAKSDVTISHNTTNESVPAPYSPN